MVTTIPTVANDLIRTITSYAYRCTRLVSATILSEYNNQPAVEQNYSVQNTGSGKAITASLLLTDTSGVQPRRIVFDDTGNLISINDKIVYYEATTEPVVNIELFEHAIRNRGFI